MKAIRCFVVSAIVAGFTPFVGSAKDSPQEMIAAAKALDEAFVAAFNVGDAEAFAATYWQSPNVVSYPPDVMEVRGADAVTAAAHEMVAAMAGSKLELTEMNYLVADEYVIGWGTWRMTSPGPEGEPVAMEGRYTDVKAKRDGKWVYILDHASVPLPPPPPPNPTSPVGLEATVGGS